MKALLVRPSWFCVEALLLCWFLVIGLSLGDGIDLTDDLLSAQSFLQQAFEPESIEDGKSHVLLPAAKLVGAAIDQPAEQKYFAVAYQPWMPVAPHDRFSLRFQRIRVYRL